MRRDAEARIWFWSRFRYLTLAPPPLSLSFYMYDVLASPFSSLTAYNFMVAVYFIFINTIFKIDFRLHKIKFAFDGWLTG